MPCVEILGGASEVADISTKANTRHVTATAVQPAAVLRFSPSAACIVHAEESVLVVLQRHSPIGARLPDSLCGLWLAVPSAIAGRV